MNTNLYSQVHFFDTLRDIVVSQPYAVLYYEEVNSFINQIEKMVRDLNAQRLVLEHLYAFRQAVENARTDGYFPIVVLPVRKFEAALALLRGEPRANR
jgi:hypothetical protein